MAKIMNLGDQTDIKWLYNVNYPVGQGCFNRRDDVLLVQIAINYLLANFVLNDAKGNRITIPGPLGAASSMKKSWS